MTDSPGRRRAALIFILATAVLDALALGVIIPVLPELVKGFLGGDTGQAARIYGLITTVWALMHFVFSPVLGALSDRFGRRPVILLSSLGLALDYALMALAPNLWWLFVGRMLSGIMASSFSTAAAYVADVTPPEKRSGAYGMMGAAFGLGFVLGPAMGGWLGEHSPRLPFWVAGGLSLLNALYGLAVLPESLPPEGRTLFSWGRANPFGSLVLLRSRAHLLGLASLHFLNQLSHQVYPAVFVLYATHRFEMSKRSVGLMLAAVGICNIVVQAGLVRRVVARFGERASVLVGLLFGSAGFALYGLAWSEAIFWLAVPVFALMGLFGPALQGLMSRRVEPGEQGQLQGANGSIAGITGVIGPAIYTETFKSFIVVGALPGAPFLLASLLLAAGLPIAWRSARMPGK